MVEYDEFTCWNCKSSFRSRKDRKVRWTSCGKCYARNPVGYGVNGRRSKAELRANKARLAAERAERGPIKHRKSTEYMTKCQACDYAIPNAYARKGKKYKCVSCGSQFVVARLVTSRGTDNA